LITELYRYAVGGSETDWDSALKSQKPKTTMLKIKADDKVTTENNNHGGKKRKKFDR